MRKRVGVTLAVCLVAVAGVIGWQIFRLRQPVYQGKTLLSWLLLHAGTSPLSDEDRAAHHTAEIAVRHIGTNGLPTLLAWAGMRDSRFKKKVMNLMGEEVRSKLAVFSANDYRSAASYAFGMLQSMAKPAVPELIRLLQDTEPDVRSGAAWCLCRIGPAAEEAVPALMKSLDDPEAQNNAFAALRSIGAKPDVVVPVLISYLSYTNLGQQGWALAHLPELGRDAKAAVPKVVELLSSPEEYLRRGATNFLPKIDPEAAVKAGVK